MSIRLIAVAATDDNNGIGRDGKLLARVSEDMRWFHRLTEGGTVIVGHNTLSSFPGGRPLRNRRNIVFSRDRSLKIDGAEVVHSVKELFKSLDGDAFVIGGGRIYRMLVPFCDTVYITRYRRSFRSDTFFPVLRESDGWYLSGVAGSFVTGEGDDPEGMLCDLLVYRRRNQT